MKKIILLVVAIAVILLNATYVLSQEKIETGITVKNVCIDGYNWKVIMRLDGEIINVSQAFQFTISGFMPVKCDKNPDEVRIKNQ